MTKNWQELTKLHEKGFSFDVGFPIIVTMSFKINMKTTKN